MPQSLTKQDLQTAVERVEQGMTANTREIISHFNQSQGTQNQRLEEMDAKLDAIMEMLATRKELHNLVRALKAKGISLEESEIFTV